MVHNADYAIAKAADETGAQVLNYSAAPVYAGEGTRGYHQWLVEFTTPPHDMQAFITALDQHLKEVNSDYEAKRKGNLFLDAPTLVVAHESLFNQWLATTGKLGGQRKVPRLSNTRDIMDALLKINDTL